MTAASHAPPLARAGVTRWQGYVRTGYRAAQGNYFGVPTPQEEEAEGHTRDADIPRRHGTRLGSACAPSCKHRPLGGRRNLRPNATPGRSRRSSESEWPATPAVVLPAVSRGRGSGTVAVAGKGAGGPHPGSAMDRAGATDSYGGGEGNGVRGGTYGAISRSGGGGDGMHRLRHRQPATALTVVMAFNHRSVGPQTRQACYGRDHPVNDAEVTERHRPLRTALTVVVAHHSRSPNPERCTLSRARRPCQQLRSHPIVPSIRSQYSSIQLRGSWRDVAVGSSARRRREQ